MLLGVPVPEHVLELGLATGDKAVEHIPSFARQFNRSGRMYHCRAALNQRANQGFALAFRQSEALCQRRGGIMVALLSDAGQQPELVRFDYNASLGCRPLVDSPAIFLRGHAHDDAFQLGKRSCVTRHMKGIADRLGRNAAAEGYFHQSEGEQKGDRRQSCRGEKHGMQSLDEVVLNHIGGLLRTGPYANKDDEVLATWRRGIAAVAACPNITIKLGGIGMPRTGFDWHLRQQPIGSEELAAAIGPFMTYCIEQFGPSRCMFESNFPVDKVSFSYQVMYNAFKRLSKHYTPTERTQIFHDTAVRIYRVPV